MKILVTGAAGFIGSEVSLALLNRGGHVVGLDNLNDYYDVNLKKARLERVGAANAAIDGRFEFVEENLEDAGAIRSLFEKHPFDGVINLAAQAGVRHSLENPRAYIDSNIVGFLNILEACRQHRTRHLVYASSSSVYGANETTPFRTSDNVDHPVSLYAASKKSNELMAHAYSHLYGVPATGLRFFTVYGPWGRPDMAPIKFTKAILAGEAIDVYNYGKHTRDFTYIDDIVEGVIRVLDKPPVGDDGWDGKAPDPSSSRAPWRLYNIGSNDPVALGDFISGLETALGVEAKKNLLPLQPGDVPDTHADVTELVAEFGYRPETTLEEGIKKFVAWYREYYRA
jgi:UDP-glucuronate 4-epimerase